MNGTDLTNLCLAQRRKDAREARFAIAYFSDIPIKVAVATGLRGIGERRDQKLTFLDFSHTLSIFAATKLMSIDISKSTAQQKKLTSKIQPKKQNHNAPNYAIGLKPTTDVDNTPAN